MALSILIVITSDLFRFPGLPGGRLPPVVRLIEHPVAGLGLGALTWSQGPGPAPGRRPGRGKSDFGQLSWAEPRDSTQAGPSWHLKQSPSHGDSESEPSLSRGG